nr:helix-turn-helix domain-containing protein [Murinocardiopsis flavida]
MRNRGITLRRRKRSCVPPEDRVRAEDLAQAYTQGASIRMLAQQTGRSYGYIRRTLERAGVQLRARGSRRLGR